METYMETRDTQKRNIGHIQRGDIHGLKTHTGSGDIRKGNIGLIQKGDTHGIEIHMKRDTQSVDKQGVGTYTGSGNTYREGHIGKGQREEHNW